MMFRLSIIGILLVLSLILLQSIFETEAKLINQERMRQIEKFERDRSQQFLYPLERAPAPDLYKKDYFYIVPDPQIYEL